MTSTVLASSPDVLAAGEIIGKLNGLTTDFSALIPRVMQVGALAFVLYKLVTTRSFFKTALAAVGASLVLMLTGNMPVLSEMFKSEVTSMPAAPHPPVGSPWHDGHPPDLAPASAASPAPLAGAGTAAVGAATAVGTATAGE